jgi:putative NADH-flavin reductase
MSLPLSLPRPARGIRFLGAVIALLAALGFPAASGQSPQPAAQPQRIIVFGASGRVGSRVVAEALNRGHRVTGVSRDPAALADDRPGFTAVVGDVTDAASVAALVRGYDVVVSTIGGSNEASDDPEFSIPAQAGRALVAGLRSIDGDRPRLIVVGGGSTTLESSPGVPIDDPTDIPTGPRGARILGHRVVLNLLRTVEDLRWTFFSPALEMRPGERSGVFRVGGSVVIRDADGESRISMEDFAVAMLDEIEHPQHIGGQMTVAY